jgi:hypothetical protein
MLKGTVRIRNGQPVAGTVQFREQDEEKMQVWTHDVDGALILAELWNRDNAREYARWLLAHGMERAV